ncbi:MAG TPA: MFS transporter [Bradyrhizobium sp.]|uniref:MFS transporter n=1 Tax=Bradyrhizobium sp. TaxID=376 RepID=UPI002D7F3B7E|nr:MFS transporter [Bradyrhizobium sp.]HET7888271.1 MFS transporter [Bradyrhizobium sp.]
MARNGSKQSQSSPVRLWPLLAINFFMADMQSGIGPFVGVFLAQRGWESGLIGTAMSIGNIAGMLITTPVGGFIDASHHKRGWVIVPGAAVVAASSIILLWQNFWAVAASQVATSIAGAAIVPAVTGITLGIVGQKGFNRQNGRNQAFNHAGNMVGAAVSGFLGWYFGYLSVFLLAAAFGAITIACVLMIPPGTIDHRTARGWKEDEPDRQPHALTVLLKHKTLLVLALALAVFHLGNAAIVPLYGISAVTGKEANGPGFVATIIVIAQGTMVIASLVGMRVAEKRNFWMLLLVSFLVLPLRGLLACFLSGWPGVVPVEILDGIGTGLQSVAVPGMIARSLYSTGRVNLAQGAVITIQGAGAALSPALGGLIAGWIGFSPAFLVLGGFGLAAATIWVVLGAAVREY